MAGRHFLGGISPSLVLSEENDNIDTLCVARFCCFIELLGAEGSTRGILGWVPVFDGFVEGNVCDCWLLRVCSVAALASVIGFFVTSVGPWDFFCDFRFVFTDLLGGLVGGDAVSGDRFCLFFGEDVLSNVFVCEGAVEEGREELASLRDSLSIALTASVLDSFDSDISDR